MRHRRVPSRRHGAGEAVVSVVVGVRGVPLQDDLVLSVAVYIAHAGIVGRVGIATSVGRGAAIRALDGDGDVAVGGIGTEGVAAVAATAPHLVDGIAGRGLLVDEERAALGEGLLVQLLAIAVDVEGLTSGIAGERAPADHHLLSAADGHHTAVQLLTVHLVKIVAGLGREAEHAC